MQHPFRRGSRAVAHHLIALAAGASLAVTATSAAFAQAFPAKPVRIVVPLAAGGGTDFFARTLAPKLGELLGQSVIVENKAGGSTIIGADFVAKAPPDGYTLLLSSSTTFAINPSLFAKLPFDPVADFEPVALTGRFDLAIVAEKGGAADSIAKLVELARAKPGGVSYSSPGAGSPHHLAMELFANRAGIRLLHVPLKGAGPALQELLGQRVDVMFLDIATANPQLKGGRIKPLGIATPKRSTLLPDVPTIAEQGVPGYEASAWQGIVAPAKTPAPVIARLNAEINRALADAGVRAKLADAGVELLAGSPEDFAAYQKAEIRKWAEVIRAANIKAE